MDKLVEKYQQHIRSAFNVECNCFNINLKEFKRCDNLFCAHCPEKCDYNTTHLYGCYESVRWDNKYIYYCPCGYIFIAVPLFDENSMPIHGIITGPVIMGDINDFEETHGITNMSPTNVNDLCELISAIFAPRINAVTPTESTGDFLNTIYKELELLQSENNYPVTLEKDLQKAITEHDCNTARELLNKLLGHIFFHSNGDFKIIKNRVLELIVLLSRSAIEGGANPNEIFNLNDNYITEVEKFSSLEKLSLWLSDIINRFVSYVFSFNDVKHSDTMYKITAYIKENYMKKLTLEDISDHVYLSKTYVSKIFKEEMDINISKYINKIRIDKSKILLLDDSLSIADVANLVGYEDQSYFTKIFKSTTGISPGKYKEKHTKTEI